MSSTEIELEKEQHGCFHGASRRLLKRKHSETEPNDAENVENKSIFTSIKEKFGFKTTENATRVKKSILTSIHNQDGEHNLSYQHDDSMSRGNNRFSQFVTNKNKENDVEVPRKRVKFDEENLIVSSLTYQRENAVRNLRQQQHQQKQSTVKEEESLFARFINFTANLF